MPQNGTIDLTGGFVPAAAPKIDLSAGFEEHPATNAPPPGAADALHRSNQAVRTFNAQNPQTPGALGTAEAGAREGVLGVASGLGIPETQTPLTDMAKGVYHTLAAPPQPGWETGVEKTGYLPAVRMIKGMAEGAYNNLKQSIPDVYHGFLDYIHAPEGDEATQADAMGRLTHGLGQGIATIAPIRELVKPPASFAAKGISEGTAGLVRDVTGAGPEKIAQAGAKVGEQATGIAEKNAAATSKAELANQTDIAKAQGKYNDALAEHEGAGSDAQQEYQRARAEWEQENTEGPQKVQEQRAAEEAKQKQRQGFDQESNAHAKQGGAALDQLQKDVEKDVKGSWPKTPGVGDAERVSTNMQRRAGAAMRESGPIPSPIARIIDRYTPEGGEGEFPEVQPDISASAYEQLKDEGVLTEDEIAAMEGTGKSPAEPNFDNLQSQYSAMGKMAARSARMGDRVTAGAYGAARDVLGEEMKQLTDAAGTTEQFEAARQKFKTMARTFYNKTPVSRAIGRYREIVGSLPDHSDPGGIAAPFVRQILASDPKVFETAKAQLSQFKGAPLDELEAMRSAHEQFKSMPSKAKIIPDYVPKPEPQPGEVGPPPVHEQPVPAHVADLTAPPEPFNRSEFIKGRLQHTADYLKHMTLRELPYSAVAAGGAGLEGHPLIAAGAASAPALTYGMARLLEHPGFQEWVSREPGAGLQPGSATPFNLPEPPTSQSGPAAPSGGIQSLIKLRNMAAEKGASQEMLDGMDARIKDLDRRIRDTGAPEGVERRGSTLKATATTAVPPEVAAKIQAAGLISKGEVMPGSGVFQVEHPDFPGKTFSISATDTPADIARKLAAMRERFGK